MRPVLYLYLINFPLNVECLNMDRKTITRGTDKTAKGFTLQKIRASSIILKHLAEDHPIDFVAAVEYGGDIYFDQGTQQYIEENKNYDSSPYTFSSAEFKNTLVYFLDYWLENNKDTRIKFGFYATNGITKERSTESTEGLQLPEKPILELLQTADLSDSQLLPAVKATLVTEYKRQYSNNKRVSLSESHYSEILALSDVDWLSCLRRIGWQFNQDDLPTLETKVLDQIKRSRFAGPVNPGMEYYIQAAIFYQLELRHAKQNPDERFLKKDDVELIFRRIYQGEIDDNSLKYLSIDYTDLVTKTKQFLDDFIQKKYFVITGRHTCPTLVQRKVTLFDPAIRSKGRQTEMDADPYRQILTNFGDQVPFDRPVFLFGELGSGKSTLVAEYLRNFLTRNADVLPIFLPSAYMQDRPLATLKNVTDPINAFVNEEL